MDEQQQAELDRRRAGFDRFFREMMPVLTDFIGRLGLPEPAAVLTDADRFLPAIDAWLAGQEVGLNDRAWLLTRLGYYVGELLAQRFGGCWLVNDVPGSRHFARYVVGQFGAAARAGASVDPFEVAADCLSLPPGRRLADAIATVVAELTTASTGGLSTRAGRARNAE